MVFFGKPRLGILCELFGLLNLFGNMLPLLLAIAKRLPIIGDVLSGLEGGSNNGVNYTSHYLFFLTLIFILLYFKF